MQSAITLNLSHEAAALLLDILSKAQVQEADALRNMIMAELSAAQRPSLDAAAEQASDKVAQALENLAQAHGKFAASLTQGDQNGQRAASAAISEEETRLQAAELAYDAAAGQALDSKAESGERNRKVAYARSDEAHDKALAALRRYEPLALEMFKLFKILSLHADLALADVEAADAARLSPHAVNAGDHLKKALQEQTSGRSEAVTQHVLSALRELELIRR